MYAAIDALADKLTPVLKHKGSATVSVTMPYR